MLLLPKILYYYSMIPICIAALFFFQFGITADKICMGWKQSTLHIPDTDDTQVSGGHGLSQAKQCCHPTGPIKILASTITSETLEQTGTWLGPHREYQCITFGDFLKAEETIDYPTISREIQTWRYFSIHSDPSSKHTTIPISLDSLAFLVPDISFT